MQTVQHVPDNGREDALRVPITDAHLPHPEDFPTIVDCRIGFDERVGATALRVYLVHCALAGQNVITEADEQVLAAGAGTTPLQVRRAVVVLRALGYVR